MEDMNCFSDFKDKYKMSTEDNIFVAKRNIVDYIWKSARMEGFNVTFPATQAIYEGASVQNVKLEEAIAINNLKHAWMFLFDTIGCHVDYNYICQLNNIVGGNNLIRGAGFIRKLPVRIGGTNWSPDIPEESTIKEELVDIDEGSCITEYALNVMLYLMRKQMFLDGNKRTSMLVANNIMVSNGCGIVSIPLEHQADFFGLLIDYYETDNKNKIKQFLYENCIDGMNFD